MVYGCSYARHVPRGSRLDPATDDADSSRRSTTGDAEVVNDICSTWNGGNGICDDHVLA